METLWTRGACSVREIHEALPDKVRPALTTVQTMVYRLEKKQALRCVKRIGNANIFDAAISRDEAHTRLIDDLLALFDHHVSDTRAALIGKGDGEFMVPWALKQGSRTIFSMPRASVWRSFVLNHLVHHRGQLSVYLRLNDVPLPSMYGPSADEGSF